jgi:predicted  nucleic acid-binding Zn-ribbon protein
MAVGRKNIEDTIEYLTKMRKEITYGLQSLAPMRKEMDEVGVQKSNIEKALADYRSRVQHLEKELKKP